MSKAMRAFARWATGRQYRLVLLTILGLELLAPVAASLLVLDTLRRGPAAAVMTAALAFAGMAVIALAIGADLAALFGLVPILVAGVVSGAALRASRNLSFAFQLTVAVAIVAVGLAFALIPAAGQLGEYLRTVMLMLLQEGGLAEDQLARFAAIDATEFARGFVFLIFTGVLGALMLGFWWYALITEGVSFGPQFRELRLGRSVGIVLMVLITANVIWTHEALQVTAYMAVAGFLFQGLAVLHARSHSDNWHRAFVIVVYVALVPPLTGLATMCLSAVGLLDNFFALRRRVGAQD